uniref:Peroxidase B (Fragments) n=1 Tax=Aloe vera TaxID=34199 RepID=PERB_ALOVR|nr:RecName: Full=Peroxidase B [Aloe vera]
VEMACPGKVSCLGDKAITVLSENNPLTGTKGEIRMGDGFNVEEEIEKVLEQVGKTTFDVALYASGSWKKPQPLAVMVATLAVMQVRDVVWLSALAMACRLLMDTFAEKYFLQPVLQPSYELFKNAGSNMDGTVTSFDNIYYKTNSWASPLSIRGGYPMHSTSNMGSQIYQDNPVANCLDLSSLDLANR